jgi:predicted RNase H-like nuclease (RuvC/YqgF family)
MNKPNPVTLLLVIGFLGAAVTAANFYIGKNDEQAKRVWAEGQIEIFKKQVVSLEQERDELAKSKASLEEQTADLTKQAKAVADQLAQEKRAREALTTELAQLRKDSTGLRGQLEDERSEKEALTEDLAKAKQSYQALSNELTTLRQAKEALEKRVKEMLAARAKEAEQIVVTAPAGAGGGAAAAGAPKPAGGLQGKVLVVNREYDFVVINLGSKDAVKKGTRFAVSRGDKQIMSIEVDKLYDNMSAANMLEEEKKGWEIKEGDAVRPI